ncbi:hypothetical protein ACEPAF_3847 [Sanghuangporus sanghuang]
MRQTISHTTTADPPWASASNAARTEPLRLIKRRPRTPGLIEDNGSSSARIVNRHTKEVENLSSSVPQRPSRNDSPASFFDPDDPAFSNDPYHHPDHDGLSPTVDVSKANEEGGSPVSRYSSQSEVEPPPSYDDSTSVPALSQNGHIRRPHLEEETTTSLVTGNSSKDARSSNHTRDKAQTSCSPLSSPHSSSPNLPQSQQGTQDDMTDQEELLAYLGDYDYRSGPGGVPGLNIPMSLRPHGGLPVTTQPPADQQGRTRPVPDNTGLLRSTTMPSSTTRTVSEPLARTNTERPHLQRRGNTTANAPTTRRGPADLDRIDELDETLGIPLHHRGPYDMRGKVDTPPPRVMPVDRQHQLQSPAKQHVLVATTPLNAPPPPIPFKLNLKPGELLTRVPPSRSQTTPPERVTPAPMITYPRTAAEQPMYERPRPAEQNYADRGNVYQEIRRNEWSPEQLYESHSRSPAPVLPRDARRQPYHPDARTNSMPSSANTSRSDLRPDIPPNPHPRVQEERTTAQRHVSFQQPPPQQISALSRSISQPATSSSPSLHSASSGPFRAPPFAAHRPKRIVMPAPLRQQNQNNTYTLPSELIRGTGQNGVIGRPAPAAQPTAAIIPIHDPKKSNFLLKKRASTGASTHHIHNHLAPDRIPSSKGFFGLGLGFGKGITPESESSLPKANRKLSKRGKV